MGVWAGSTDDRPKLGNVCTKMDVSEIFTTEITAPEPKKTKDLMT